MRVPKIDKLVNEFDSATHGQRVRRMAELGRDASGTDELATLLDQLAERSTYEHRLALAAAVAARDVARLTRALSDPAVSVRSFAFAHAGQVGIPDEALLAAIVGGSQADRARLSRVILRGRRQGFADSLIDTVKSDRGDHEAASLLPACSSDVVRRLLPELDYAVANWSSLARRHPDVVLDHATRVLTEAPRHRRDALWASMGSGIAALAGVQPDRVLTLLEVCGPSFVIPGSLLTGLGRLTRHAPSRVTALVLRNGHRERLVRQGLPLGVLNNARHLPESDRVAITVALREHERLLVRYLDSFAPSDRPGLFEAAFADVDTARTIWSDPMLEVLPHAVRHDEARRMMSLREVQSSPALLLGVASFLAPDDARAELDQAIGAAKPEDRARGYQLLVACARRSRDPQQLGEVLTTLRRVRNEQDPVRMASCQALAQVPATLLAEDHLDAMRDLITAVLEARDTSGATLAFLRQWVLKLLETHALEPTGPTFAFALDALDRLAGPSGTIAFGQLDRSLPRGSETQLLAALLPRLRREADHDRYDLVLALATSLGRRAWDLDDLQQLVGRATAHSLDSVVRRAVALWLAPSTERGARVEALIKRDASMVTLDPVLKVINRRRQDLLDVVLSTKKIRGRFLSGNVRFVPMFHSGFQRWLPRQTQAYADALRSLINDKATKSWTVMQAVRTIARLPEVGFAGIAPDLASTDVVRIEAAMTGLAWTDKPQDALELLLSFAPTDRARVAVYAATRCARFVEPAQLSAPLFAVLQSPDAKITSRKEAIRLLGIHRPPGALDALIDLAAQTDLHRDLRITIGRSVRSFLGDDRSWGVLRQLATGDVHAARSLLETSPTQVSSRHRAAFGALIALVTQHPHQLARQEAFTVLASWAPWTPDAPDLARRCIEDLDSGNSWHAAAISLTAMFRDGLAAEATRNLVANLIATADELADDAAPERDRPRRQRLMEILGRLMSLSSEDLQDRIDELQGLAALLETDRSLLHQEIAFRLSTIGWSSSEDWTEEILARVEGRPHAGMAASIALKKALEKAATSWEPTEVLPACDRLIARSDATASLLALAIATTAGPRLGWNEAWRSRLRTLRTTGDPDVTAFALLNVTAKE